MDSSTSLIQKSVDERSRSSHTMCSSNSSCILRRRKPMNPLAKPINSLRTNNNNNIRQRVMSAKLLKLRSIQNQLNDANFHLAEVTRENQVLKTLQKRQDKALSKYEGTNADLPRILRSHEEEIRFLSEKNKNLRRSIKELNEQLKHKEDELTNMQEQLKHLDKLNKDKHLVEREKLMEQLDDLKDKLQRADNQINLLNRKLTLESKNAKHKLNSETVKHKKCIKELSQALEEIDRLNKLLEPYEGMKVASKRSSTINLLVNNKSNILPVENEAPLFENDKAPVSEIKLEPLKCRKDLTDKDVDEIMKCPSKNVKARLSAGSMKARDDDLLQNFDKISLSDSDYSGDNRDYFNKNFCESSSSNSSRKLEKIETSLENIRRKVEENSNDEVNKRLGAYCSQAVNSVKTCNIAIDYHSENLIAAKQETDKLMEAFMQTGNMEKKLKQSHLLTIENSDLKGDGLNLVNKILEDELHFNKNYKDRGLTQMNDDVRNGNYKQKQSSVATDNKNKLLATLQAIDNGDNVDSFDIGVQRKNKLLKDLFGDLTD